MRSFLCRVLIAVFLLNCLTPSTGWGQSAARKRTPRSLDQRVQDRTQEAQLKNSPAYQFFEADRQARAQHNEQFARADQQARQDEQARLAQPAGVVWTPVSTRVVTPAAVLSQTRISSSQDFLRKVAKNEVTFDQLIDYADPLDPSPDANPLRTTAYAAEVIGNTVSQMAMLDRTVYNLDPYLQLLPQIEARLLYRLALLGFEAPSYTANRTEDPVSLSRAKLTGSFQNSLDKILAVGTLRMALLKIHQFYKRQNLPDPVEDYQVHMRALQLAQTPQTLQAGNPEMGRPRLENGLSPRSLSPTQAQQQQAAKEVQKNGNLADFQRRFIYELRDLHARKPEETSGDFYLLQVTAEYATAYSMEYDLKQLRTIVGIFDEGVKKDSQGHIVNGNFKRTYAPIVNAVFNTIFENTRYAQMSAPKTKQVMALLEEFSDPQKYSLPTRVAALEAASLLYRPFHQETLQGNTPQSPFTAFIPLNFNQPDDNLRKVFAAHTVALYCPLNATSNADMQTYGLDSEGMRTLADQLAYIYDGFYDISTTTISMPGQGPHHQPGACYIAMKNQPNFFKKRQEDAETALWWTANTLFFIFGGDVFQLLGTAFRLTRGAVVALPKARQAFSLAQRGEKIAAFNAQIRDGAKFANWIYQNNKQQARLVEFVVQKAPARTETQRIVENGVVKTVTKEIPAVEESRLITTTHQLQGKRSLLNPKRWVQPQGPKNIVGMRVTSLSDGTVGEMRFGEMVEGQFVPKPVNGIHSLEELSAATRQLRTPSGDRFWFDQQPYWQGILNTNQAYLKQSWLKGLEGMEKEFDILAPIIDKTQMNLPAGAANLLGKEAKWWNLTSWGLPPQGFQIHKTLRFVAPKSKLNLVGTAQRLQAQGGLLNAPGQLPGFYTTQALVEEGNITSQMFNAFFKPLNWKNPVAKTFLPDYIPTATFWKSIQTNPVLGVKLLPKLLWRNRFATTTWFFATWSAADYGLHPALSHWITQEAAKDVRAETAKYGEALTKKRAEENERLSASMGMLDRDPRRIQAYKKVSTAVAERTQGTLLAAASLTVRRAAGMKFITPRDQASLYHQAHKAELNHANLQKAHAALAQSKLKWEQQTAAGTLSAEQQKALEQEKRDIIHQEYQAFLDMYASGFAARPELKRQVDQLYQNYERDFFSTPAAQIAQLNDTFLKKVQALEEEVKLWNNAAEAAQTYVDTFQALYSNEPGLITPELVQSIYQTYYTYAENCMAIVHSSATPQQQKDQIKDQQDQIEEFINDLWEDLRARYKQAHPELTTPQEEPAEQTGPVYGTPSQWVEP